MLWLTLSILFVYALLLAFYLRGWKAAGEIALKDKEHSSPFLSVVVAARNESANIEILLSALQQQTLSAERFEVIIVDDYSDDDTAAKVKAFGMPNLRLMQPLADALHSSKKKAIEAGVAAAKGNYIVTTDADCLPHTGWLQTIYETIQTTGASFIAAPVKFSHTNFFEVFQCLDFIVLQGITSASVHTKLHAMCNGANLAYSKTAFEKVDGFKGIDLVATGDDMLLMHKIWKLDPSKVVYLKDREAIVSTAPMPTLNQFLMQRRRWASKTFVYQDARIIAILLFVFALNLYLFGLAIAAILIPQLWWTWLIAIIVKTIVEWPFTSQVASFFGEKKLMRYFLFFQPFHIAYTVIVGAVSQFGKYEWKGRKTK